MAMSRKIMATISDADFRDCVNTGYTYTVYADGHVAAEYHSRWQGSTDGTRYVTDPGFVDPADVDPDDPDTDWEACLTMAIHHSLTVVQQDPSESRYFRQVRRGWTVR